MRIPPVLCWVAACAAAWAGCAGGRTAADSVAPGWVHQAARTVEGGYIVYLGEVEDQAPERARFKAEAAAIQDLANECSFAPKGARVEDHFDQPTGVIHHAYAK